MSHRGPREICSVRSMTEPEAAWIGAFIEAEGSVTQKTRLATASWRITVVNTDPEMLSALLRVTGVGLVYSHNPKTMWGRRHAYIWNVSRIADLAELARRCAIYSPKIQRLIVAGYDQW